MDILKFAAVGTLLLTQSAFASGEDMDIDPRTHLLETQSLQLCNSTDEFIKTLKFLRQNKDVIFTEGASQKIAERVSQSCNGAADRFAQILTLLKSVGLSDQKALLMSLEFATYSPDVQKNFTEIFNRAYLGEFFDYEYPLAAKLAYEMSKDYQGDPVQLRQDFIELVRFCKDGKNLDLPLKLCAELTVKLARLTQYHPKGIRDPFYRLLKDLRTKPEFALDLKTALDITYNVLKNGPKAPDNFFAAYAYASKKDGLDFNRTQAMAFALRMAERSHTGEHPPVYPGLTNFVEANHATVP